MKRNILITGDSRGLGRKTKEILEGSGYSVIGLSRNSDDIRFDLVNIESIKELYHDEIKPRGPIHGFVNNSAYAYDDIITNLNLDRLEYMYRVNVFSPMMLTKFVIRDMILNRVEGSMVHVSSISVHTGYKGLSMYASTKGSLEAFSKNISREWGRMGIRSNVVCPGFMNTEMSSSLSDEQKEKIFKRNSLMKELEIIDVCSTIKYLLSNESKGLTGSTIHVDNGTL